MRQPGRKQAAKPPRDLSLLDRRKVLRHLETVRSSGRLSRSETEQLAHRLARFGAIVPATLVHALERESDPVVIGVAARTLEWMVESDALPLPSCVAAIQRLLHSPDLPDEARLRLLVSLRNLGVDVSDVSYAAAFKDFSAVTGALRDCVLGEIAADDARMAQLLEEMAQLSLETRAAIIEDYSLSAHPIIPRLFLLLGRSEDPAMGRLIVEGLQRMRTPRAAGALQRLSVEAICSQTRERALHASKALRFSGVKPLAERGKARKGVCSSILSASDGVGSRMIWIARKAPTAGHVTAIHLMVNDLYGIKDCFGSSSIPKTEYDERVQSLEQPGEIAYDRFSADYCLTLIRDALYTNVQTGSPVAPQFLLYMEVFAGCNLEPERYVPSFDDVELGDASHRTALVKESARVLQLPALSTWFMISEAIYGQAERANRLTRPGPGKSAFKKNVREQLRQIHRTIVAHDIIPTAHVLRRRMELMADYFLQSSTPLVEPARALLAACVQLPGEALRAETAPELAEHPFLLEMARRSLENAQIALRMGYDYRRNPERF